MALINSPKMMQTVDLNGQLDIIRIIDPSVDIEQLKKAIIKIPLHQPIDDFKFNKVTKASVRVSLTVPSDKGLCCPDGE